MPLTPPPTPCYHRLTQGEHDMTAAQKIQATLNKQTTKQLQEMAKHLMNDYREGTDYVMNAVLDVLIERMGDDFEEFAEAL